MYKRADIMFNFVTFIKKIMTHTSKNNYLIGIITSEILKNRKNFLLKPDITV